MLSKMIYFACEDIISSHVRISYRVYQFVTTRYSSNFYIIKSIKPYFGEVKPVDLTVRKHCY